MPEDCEDAETAEAIKRCEVARILEVVVGGYGFVHGLLPEECERWLKKGSTGGEPALLDVGGVLVLCLITRW